MKSHLDIYTEQIRLCENWGKNVSPQILETYSPLLKDLYYKAVHFNVDKFYAGQNDTLVDVFYKNCKKSDGILIFPQRIQHDNNIFVVSLILLLQTYTAEQLATLLAKKDASDVLLFRDENNAAISVEKFIAELESRLALIKPILSNQTEEFLGYCQDDITKLSDFFAGRFVRFGMDAVAVQKILRNIWLQTPCEDKMLNYALYKFIDEKFYGIVNERKRTISFDHIPAPEDGSWETLENDWKARSAHYAKELEIDIDYLDGEAVDGRIFPSASGLFAQPAFLPGREIEFLNFWMPHLTKLRGYDDTSFEKTVFAPTYLNDKNILTKIRLLSTDWLKPYIDFFENNNAQSSEPNIYQAQNDIVATALTEPDIEDVTPENYVKILIECEENWYNETAKYYAGTLPANFFLKSYSQGEEYFSTFGSNCEKIDLPDNAQLPEFINSCWEYVIAQKEVKKSKYLRFYNGKKIYFPEALSKELIESAEAFLAARQEVPDFVENTENPIATYAQHLYDYYRNYFLKYIEFTKIRSILLNGKKYGSLLFSIRSGQLEERIQVLANLVMEDKELSDLTKRETLVFIKNVFSDAIGDQLNDILTNFIESKGPDPENFTVFHQIKYFYDRNQFEKTQKELELQLCEVNTRIKERNENFQAINHDIKNMIRAIKIFIDKNDFTQANRGLEIITNIVDAVNASFRKLPDKWKEDLSSQESDKSLKDILNNALLYGIPNMFCHGYEKIYETETLNYFEWAEDADEARLEWNKLTDPEEKFEWVSNNMFKLEWDDQADTQNIKIGNKYHIATHFFIMFNEIFLNAIKAISYVQNRPKRGLIIKLKRNDNLLSVTIRNSAEKNNEEYQKGLGFGNHLIIDNYINLFQIKDFSTIYDDKDHIYEVNFSIPVMK